MLYDKFPFCLFMDLLFVKGVHAVKLLIRSVCTNIFFQEAVCNRGVDTCDSVTVWMF